jgi:hypothetical protein
MFRYYCGSTGLFFQFLDVRSKDQPVARALTYPQTQNKHTYTSMTRVRFEPAKTVHVLDCVATEISCLQYCDFRLWSSGLWHCAVIRRIPASRRNTQSPQIGFNPEDNLNHVGFEVFTAVIMRLSPPLPRTLL